jgi:hypothetical protein
MKLNDLLNKPTSSVAELAKKYKVSTDSVEKQLAQGIKVEMEHTRLRSVAREIALDHLGEDLNYYKKLSKLEKKPAQEALLIELFALLNEVKIDNVSGIGEVPDNRNVDYLGLRVLMKPSVFLSLASKISRDQATSVDYIKQQLDQGQGMASPWLVLDIPVEWDEGSLEKPARVTAHEGRNRMYAVLETEGDVPVETHLFFAGLRARHIKPKWIEALNTSLVPQRQSSAMAGPFFSTDTSIDERAGAPGTLKAKITRLYGGNVTCEKAKKLKNRRSATSHDKAQANWFLNMQDCKPLVQEVGGVGTVVKGVNTTADVGPREIQKQARKFLNKVTTGGVPPQTQSNGKFPSVK